MDFCPIVMGNFHYKVYTKVLASRLGSFVGSILSNFQFGFISGRRIHTCIALASDVINFLDLGSKGHMALKVVSPKHLTPSRGIFSSRCSVVCNSRKGSLT